MPWRLRTRSPPSTRTARGAVDGFVPVDEIMAAPATPVVPIHFHRLLHLSTEARERYDLSSLQAVAHAGASCPVDVKHAMIDWFGPVL